ncbi:MAG: dienelactone hydrolase family protein [Trueperaceae bacterium]
MDERLERPVEIATEDATLQGDLALPTRATGVVLFAHGSGSGRRSPRNRFVARGLQRAGLATLLVDLLTEEEARIDDATHHLRFDVAWLAGRLTGAMRWLAEDDEVGSLPLGLFGASTGAAAALIAAGRLPGAAAAVVSRGGRPDLAGNALAGVRAPTLLIVGGLDTKVIELNEQAQRAMTAPNRLAIVPYAGHLFEEPGTLEAVVDLAADWFTTHLRAA